MAYVEQEHYIISDTLQKNILFGLPMEEQRFKDAVRYARLVSEVRAMSKGLASLVGEKGITLSGG